MRITVDYKLYAFPPEDLQKQKLEKELKTARDKLKKEKLTQAQYCRRDSLLYKKYWAKLTKIKATPQDQRDKYLEHFVDRLIIVEIAHRYLNPKGIQLLRTEVLEFGKSYLKRHTQDEKAFKWIHGYMRKRMKLVKEARYARPKPV